jgi:putative transposase
MKRHKDREIVAKLRKANELAAEGLTQAEICKNLGVSVMTFHRWRKLSLVDNGGSTSPAESQRSAEPIDHNSEIDFAQLRDENLRLRSLITDLLLEKMKLEELANRSLRGRKRA